MHLAGALEPPPRRAAVPSASTADPGDSDLEREAARLASPLAKIRRGGDVAAALAEIDDYLSSFPRGALRPEAKLARVDALLMLGRRQAALDALDQIDLDTNRRSLELRLVRGELRAQSDCREARRDFDEVVMAAPSADLLERALRGRAACNRRVGDAAAARRDFEVYLRRFPTGRFAAEARALLESDR
jgi:tetratricopeptide (TPR) repeat protein